uniref:Cyclin N-terminal domain-containing protein n=1 Tax=Panagrellus redivivus TaxID=6233 RepID=A0A7E4V187_PANRE
MSRKPLGPPFPTSRDLMLKPGFQKPGTSAMLANRSIPPASRRHAETDSPSSTSSSHHHQSAVWPKDYETVSTFMFTKECLESTPSLRYHGITPAEEMQLRLIGTVWIKELYLRINVRYKNPQNAPRISVRACCVAMIYFHRFYMYHSFGTFDPTHVATAALFLATKCEECPIRMKHFVTPLYNVSFPHDPDPLESEDEAILEELITSMETHVIRTLSFELKPNLCHYEVIKADFLEVGLKKAAWQICSDLYQYTTVCLLHNEKTLAGAAIFAGSSYVGVKLHDLYGDDWLERVAPGTDFGIVIAITNELSQSYEKYQKLFPKLPDATQDSINVAVQAEEFQRATNAAANNVERRPQAQHVNPPPDQRDDSQPPLAKQPRLDVPSSSQSRQHSVSQSRERHHSSRSEKEGKSDRHSHSRHDSVGDRQTKERHREHKSDRHQRESSGAGDYRHHSGPAPAYHPGNLNVRDKADSLQQFALNTRQQHREDKEEGEIE